MERLTDPSIAAEQVKSEQPAEQSQTSRPLPRIDQKFAGETNKYFQDQFQQQIEPSDEVEDYYRELPRDLNKLAHGDPARVRTTDVAMAIGRLAGNMQDNPSVLKGYDSESRDDGHLEGSYLAAKKLFMDSCSKLYPDMADSIDPSSIATDIRSAINRVNAISTKLLMPSQEMAIPQVTQIQTMRKVDPSKLAGKIDDTLSLYCSLVGNNSFVAFRSFSNGEIDGAQYEEQLTLQANLNEQIYKLQLLRDQLTEGIYGNPEVTPSDMEK